MPSAGTEPTQLPNVFLSIERGTTKLNSPKQGPALLLRDAIWIWNIIKESETFCLSPWVFDLCSCAKVSESQSSSLLPTLDWLVKLEIRSYTDVGLFSFTAGQSPSCHAGQQRGRRLIYSSNLELSSASILLWPQKWKDFDSMYSISSMSWSSKFNG